MDFVMAEEDQSSADAGVAEVVCSELTSLHSGFGGCVGRGHYSRRATEMLVMVVGGRRCSSSYGVHSPWHMQEVLMVIQALEPELDLGLAGITSDHSSRWHACRSGQCSHFAAAEAAMGLIVGGHCWLACTSSLEAYEALLRWTCAFCLHLLQEGQLEVSVRAVKTMTQCEI